MKQKNSTSQNSIKYESDMISEFFAGLELHIQLSNREHDALVNDFNNAIDYYISTGLSLEDALARLDASNLGDFYVNTPRLWYALDNAAKIYPLTTRHGFMPVFRLSLYLKENVVPEILQMALTFTIKRFQSFAVTIKKGFFWHYLNTTKRRYIIEPEKGLPCRPIKVSGGRSQAFRVLYYNNRISLECFHILTDGYGGLVFLKTLAAEYFRLMGVQISTGYGVWDINDAAAAGETANEFSRADKTDSTSGFVDKAALQFGGRLAAQRPCRIIHFKVASDKLKEIARSKNATITAYILALMFMAGKMSSDKHSGDFNIQVPVDMRKHYASNTIRNFSMYCGIRLSVAEITDVDSILAEVSRQLERKASKAAMSEMMNATEQLVGMVRYVPLFIKGPVARLVCGFLDDRIFSSVLSNLGVVTMPPELASEIESMDCAASTSRTNRANCSMITYNNITALTIVKATCNPAFDEALYRLLAADGITPVVEGSEQLEG